MIYNPAYTYKFQLKTNLVAAFWLNVLHLDLCRVCFKRSILKKVSSNAREAKRAKFRFKLYSCYAWGIPILGLVWLQSFQLDFFVIQIGK